MLGIRNKGKERLNRLPLGILFEGTRGCALEDFPARYGALPTLTQTASSAEGSGWEVQPETARPGWEDLVNNRIFQFFPSDHRGGQPGHITMHETMVLFIKHLHFAASLKWASGDQHVTGGDRKVHPCFDQERRSVILSGA